MRVSDVLARTVTSPPFPKSHSMYGEIGLHEWSLVLSTGLQGVKPVGTEADRCCDDMAVSSTCCQVVVILRGLSPRGEETDQAAHGTCQANDTIVEVDVAKSTAGHSAVAYVRNELDLSCSSVPDERRQHITSRHSLHDTHTSQSS